MIYLELFWTFFKIGILTFGGGYAMIPMIESEAITKRWITEEMLIDFLAVSESTPGSFAVNISTFIGNSQAGILGAIIATLGVVLPSFIVILVIFKFYKRFIKNKYVIGTLNGLRAVVVGLVISVGLGLFYDQLITQGDIKTFNFLNFVLIVMLILLQIGYKKVFNKPLNPIVFILISAILGVVSAVIIK